MTRPRAPRLTGVFGGTGHERLAWLAAHPPANPVITCEAGTGQCRCGGYIRFLYRRRWVCVRCAAWVHVDNPAVRRWKIRWATNEEGAPGE